MDAAANASHKLVLLGAGKLAAQAVRDWFQSVTQHGLNVKIR